MRKSSVLLAVVAVELIVCNVAAAQLTTESITLGQSFTLNSKILNEERKILVHLPEGYDYTSAQYPVLYVLDGNRYFLPASGMTKFLSVFRITPEMIVVAIPNTNRLRDLSPTNSAVDFSGNENHRYFDTGGGDEFLTFINDELFPLIDANYRTKPFRIFSGHSLGGLLVIHTLLSQPDMFDAYIAISPSFWFDDQEIVKRAERILEETTELHKLLYFSVEEVEEVEDDRDLRNYRHMEGVQDLGELLEQYAPKGLRWKFDLVPGENHLSLWNRSHNSGLEFVFMTLPPPDIDPTEP